MKKAAVLGWPIEQSMSPVIHGFWLGEFGIDGSYEKIAFRPEEFESGVRKLIADGYSGANVTAPHKLAAVEIADQVTERAAQIGAANTLVFKSGEIHADNTDGEGFFSNLVQGAPEWNVASGPALVLGAGGAARAVLDALITAGAPEIILVNRTRAKAEELANVFGRKVVVANWSDANDAAGAAALIVNSTSLGMKGKPALEFSCANLTSSALVTDLVYNPLETQLLKDAKAKGNKTVDGLGMLLHQAVPGFEAWFGKRPSVTKELRSKIEALL